MCDRCEKKGLLAGLFAHAGVASAPPEAVPEPVPDLLNASDAVICPTDCVGHLAYYQLKKHCKQNGKPCVLTRNSGVAGFAAALNRLAEGRADIQTQT
jgi:hypothetical protein